jgi:PIN like domain
VSVRAALVRIYVDADIRGLGITLGGLRSDVTYPGDPGAEIHKRLRPPCPIASANLLDIEWIPEVARRGWLIITRDNNIIHNRAEIAAVRDNGARMVALNQQDAKTKWGQLEVFMTQWRAIEALTGQPGPFIVRARTRHWSWHLAHRRQPGPRPEGQSGDLRGLAAGC